MKHAIKRGRGLLGVLALSGFAACWLAEPTPPTPLSPPAAPEARQRLRFDMRSVPRDVHPPSAAQKLEQRLAALSRDVERRLRRTDDARVGHFDVEGLTASLTAMLERYEDRASLSVHVRDLSSGDVLFDYFGDTPLIPASNQKIVTSAAALDLLGPDYVFVTRVLRKGPVLYLEGRGDPLLQVDDLAAIAQLVTESVDVAALERLVIDDSVFTSRRFGPGYDPDGPGHSYQAPSGALSLSFNTVEIMVYPVAGRSRPAVVVSPASAHVRVDNRARTGTRNSLAVRTHQQGDRTVVQLAGRIPKTRGPLLFRRRITDPGLFTGEVLAAQLAGLGVSEPLPVERGMVPAEAEVLVENESLPLWEVLDSGLAYSNNFIAEQTLRTLAWRMTGDPGDWNAGQQILHDYWQTLTGPQPVVFKNASGLHREGRLTTQGLVDLIEVAHRNAEPGRNLIDALPVAGEPGTLRSRLRLSGKRVRAKTGTLDRVSGLSGVITSEQGDPLVGFSILTNVVPEATLVAETRRGLEDRIVMEVLRVLDDYEAQRSGLQAPRSATG